MNVTKQKKLCTVLLIALACTLPVDRAYCSAPGDSEAQNRPTTGSINRDAPGPSSFKANMPLSEAINILRNSTSPPLNIVVLWRDLERNADIYKDTPIGIDGVSGVPLRTHLKLLLLSLSSNSPEKLGYVIESGVVIIATQNSLLRRLRPRVYYIADLVFRQ